MAAAASPLRDSLQQPRSVPVPVGDVARAQAVEAGMGEAKLALLLGGVFGYFEGKCKVLVLSTRIPGSCF